MTIQLLGTVLMTLVTVLVLGAVLISGLALARARTYERASFFLRRRRAGLCLIAAAAVLLMTPSPGFSDTVFALIAESSVHNPMTVSPLGDLPNIFVTDTQKVLESGDLVASPTNNGPLSTITYNWTITNMVPGNAMTDLTVYLIEPATGYAFTAWNGGKSWTQVTPNATDTVLSFTGTGLSESSSNTITLTETLPQTSGGARGFGTEILPGFTATSVPEPSALVEAGLATVAGIAYGLARIRRGTQRVRAGAERG